MVSSRPARQKPIETAEVGSRTVEGSPNQPPVVLALGSSEDHARPPGSDAQNLTDAVPETVSDEE